MSTNSELLSAAAVAAFHLNGQFLNIAEGLARPAGLTAARWQVLGAVLSEPLSVAGIARAMGITRQGVQRLADLLVREGMAEYVPNPSHRRAKLLCPTAAGRRAIEKIKPGHSELADRLAAEVGVTELRRAVRSLERLSHALDALDSFDGAEAG
jgi:DNA-binding MarR family transcriptional regulator